MAGREAVAVAFDHAVLAKITGEIVGCDALEWRERTCEATDIGVDVLD